jgi:hypothetical protein
MNNGDSKSNVRERFQHIVYTWFVRYNPLYFFSALCVLSGMFLVSRGLNVMEWTRGQLALTVIMQVYEWLLIVGGALLFRKAGQDRPAVILGIMEVVLLFDCTFRTEVATTLDHSGRMIAVGWVIMVILKLMALFWIFHLKLSTKVLVVPILMAIGIAGFPQLFQQYDTLKGPIHLIATWFGIGVITFLYWQRPTIACRLWFDEWGQTVLRRANTAAWSLWTGLYFCHLFIWIKLFDIPFTLLHFVSLLLLLPLLSKKEQKIWAGSGITLAFALFNPSTVSLTALAVGLVLGWQGWHLQQKRLYVGAVLAGYIAAWTFGWNRWPLPEFNLWFSLLTAAILIVMAWRLRLPIALLPLISSIYPAMKVVNSLNLLGKGILLLAIGFIALIVGVAFNWSQRTQSIRG